jgi:hypothetical protein
MIQHGLSGLPPTPPFPSRAKMVSLASRKRGDRVEKKAIGTPIDAGEGV